MINRNDHKEIFLVDRNNDNVKMNGYQILVTGKLLGRFSGRKPKDLGA